MAGTKMVVRIVEDQRRQQQQPGPLRANPPA